MRNFNVRSPFFATAGKVFGWDSAHGMAGIGIAKSKLKGLGNSGMVCNTDKKKRTIYADVGELFSFYQSNPDSRQNIKGTEIIIFPLNLWSEIVRIDDNYKLF